MGNGRKTVPYMRDTKVDSISFCASIVLQRGLNPKRKRKVFKVMVVVVMEEEEEEEEAEAEVEVEVSHRR